MCKRELETEQNCNILTHTLLAITAFLSRSPGLLNRGPGGPASLGHVPQPSIFSPTAQSGVPRPSSAGCCFLYSTFQLPNFLSSLGLYNSLTPTKSLPINSPRNMQLPPSLKWYALIIIERKWLSCSSQVTLFRCISLWLYRGILTLSHIVSQVRLRQRNMQLPPSLEWHVWPCQRSIYNSLLFSFSSASCLNKTKEPICPTIFS